MLLSTTTTDWLNQRRETKTEPSLILVRPSSNPKLAEAYLNRGVAKSTKGDQDGAIDDESKAIELNPKLAEAYLNRGAAKQTKGDLEGAIADFNQALELDPTLAEAYLNRGLAKVFHLLGSNRRR
jgi:tetratricopeptide (TPR) repeat protein